MQIESKVHVVKCWEVLFGVSTVKVFFSGLKQGQKPGIYTPKGGYTQAQISAEKSS